MTTQSSPHTPRAPAAAAPPSVAAAAGSREPLSLAEQGMRLFEDLFLTTRSRPSLTGPSTT